MKGDIAQVCPCCRTCLVHVSMTQLMQCPRCSYSCRVAHIATECPAYENTAGRNDMPECYTSLKFQERVSYLRSHISTDSSLIEIGCAEGTLGKRIKELINVHTYWGVEPSRDSEKASLWIDNVVPDSRSALSRCGEESFDILLAFHVLEHIREIEDELTGWHRLLRCGGKAVIEVPNKSGNQLVLHDGNPEHLHFFTVPSLALLAVANGFDIESITTGHYESPAYNDCIRAVLTRPASPSPTEQAFIDRVFNHIHEPFSIYGIGGDFRSYILPLMDRLPVLSLIDSSQALVDTEICGRKIETYTPSHHQSHPILVTSIRYERQISDSLVAMQHPAKAICYLSEILDR